MGAGEIAQYIFLAILGAFLIFVVNKSFLMRLNWEKPVAIGLSWACTFGGIMIFIGILLQILREHVFNS